MEKFTGSIEQFQRCINGETTIHLLDEDDVDRFRASLSVMNVAPSKEEQDILGTKKLRLHIKVPVKKNMLDMCCYLFVEGFTDATLIQLLDEMRDNTSIKKLSFNANNINLHYMGALWGFFLLNRTVEELTLSFAKIGKTIAIITNVLSINPVLKSLNLTGSFFSEDAMKNLCHTMIHNTTLKSLHFRNCTFERGAYVYIGYMICENKGLEQFTLHCEYPNDKSIMGIVEALKTNTTLKKFGVGDNFSKEAMDSLWGVNKENKNVMIYYI